MARATPKYDSWVSIPEMKEERAKAILKERGGHASISPDEFIAEMEGFIKKNSSLPRIDPLKLRHIWNKGGEHDLH